MSNIVAVVVADKNLATMLRNVKATELALELSKTGPYTVFAPPVIIVALFQPYHLVK